MIDPTRDSIATLVADSSDPDMQSDLCGDIWMQIWPSNDTYWPLMLTREDLEYSRSRFAMGDVMDMMWSSCRNNMN